MSDPWSVEGGPAFPTGYDGEFRGMSLRDWFAGQMAPILYAQLSRGLMEANASVENTYRISAAAAYEAADAMLAERSK